MRGKKNVGMIAQAPSFKQVLIFLFIAVVSVIGLKIIMASVNKMLEQLGLKKTDAERKQEDFDNLIEAVETGNAGDGSRSGTEYKADAQELATALGTNYASWNPLGWWEDEEKAVSILLDYDADEFPVLDSMYRVETGGRGLQDDCVYYLDGYLDQVKYLWE